MATETPESILGTTVSDGESELPRQPDAASIVTGQREQLFHLLAEASEIEHTLMCSYLYAAFSLKRGERAELSSAESESIERWRKNILAVATEEMVHLLLVCNLSVALGGRPHLGRPNFPVTPGYFPSGVVVKLAPFSPDTLQHFIFLERPMNMELADGEGFEGETDYDREEAFIGLMPSVQDYRTVGKLYEALSENLKAFVARHGERCLFLGPSSAQIGPKALKLPGIREIVDLPSALAAIESIVEQGEGSAGDREDSHFKRFVLMKSEYDEALKRNPRFEPAWPAAVSPVMRRPPTPEDKVFVESRPAAELLDFGNAIYCQLLRCLGQCFGRTDESAGLAKSAFLEAAISLMHLVAVAGETLATLPAIPGSAVHAGLSFTMLRSVEPFFGGATEQDILLERMDELSQGAQRFAHSSANLREVTASLNATGDALRLMLAKHKVSE